MEDKDRLNQCGLKATPARLCILATLRQQNQPMSAKELLTQNPSLDLSTIYRCVQLLSEHGLLQTLTWDGDKAIYYTLGGHHHYMMCKNCHKLEPMDTCPLSWQNSVCQQSGFQITEHKLEFYGYCAECQKKHVH